MRDAHNAKGYYREGAYAEGGRNRRTGDKLRLSDPKGNPINLVQQVDGKFRIHEKEKERLEGFIQEMSGYLKWDYLDEKWCWSNLSLKVFTKDDFQRHERSLNNKTFLQLMQKNPLSLAMTSGTNIEFTLENPDHLV